MAIKMQGIGFKIKIMSTKKRASYLYRTATTVYPCCLPTLGDSTGAGRTRLTRERQK